MNRKFLNPKRKMNVGGAEPIVKKNGINVCERNGRKTYLK